MGFGSNPFPTTTKTAAFVTVDFSGEKDIIRAFNLLGPRVERKVMRAALTKAARPIAKEAKALLKGHKGRFKDSHGVLWRSIGIKTKTRKTGFTYAVIGPQRRKGRWVVPLADKRKKGRVRFKAMTPSQAGRALLSGKVVGGIEALNQEKTAKGIRRKRQFRIPTKYAHLIQGGTKFFNAFDFMEKAWRRQGSDVALGTIRRELWKGTRKELGKLNTTGK